MADSIELDDLSSRTPKTVPSKQGQIPDTNFPTAEDGVIVAWAWASALILLVLAVPLILSPRLLLFLSETSTDVERRAALTPLESFMALHTGILLFAVALALIFNIPSDPIDDTPRRDAVGHPLLGPLSAACVLISFIAYNTKSVGPLSFLVCLGSGTMGLWGMWAILFAGSSYISRKTGADKRTSRFLFGNKAAASVQKKQWKREQEGRSKAL
ncbi:hypothetical protein C8Q77DRAFT_1207093 [Trametes polyzona]|nr:hypothetical protein C8Q77DRAFT_1207093 [Trametes polyzona]